MIHLIKKKKKTKTPETCHIADVQNEVCEWEDA